MYCILLYLDYRINKRCHDGSTASLNSDQSVDVDPEHRKIYFNPNCILQLILNYISSEAHINIEGDAYDLCTISGDLLGVKDYKPTISGLAIFQPRETYYIVMIKRSTLGLLYKFILWGDFASQNTNGKAPIEEIIPLLSPTSQTHQILKSNLKERNLIKKRSVNTKKSGSRLSISKYSSGISQSSNVSNTPTRSRRVSSANV